MTEATSAGTEPVRVLVVDDQELFRRGLIMLLGGDVDIEVVGEAADGITATELAITDPQNAGPAAVRASGKLCYASSNRAVTALAHLWHYARFRQRRGL